jgi:hypothetical protein
VRSSARAGAKLADLGQIGWELVQKVKHPQLRSGTKVGLDTGMAAGARTI